MNVRNVLLGCATVLMVASLYLVFIYVPTEATMGVVQRIFYFHVPLAWVAFLAFFVVFAFSILYLWKRAEKWDILASASAEVGTVFTTLFLATGSIWAKPIWGVWWTWDPRLTSALILWIIYIAYHLVRTYAGGGSRSPRLAAVVGIVGFIDVPIVALAITLWRTQHPGPAIFQGGLAPSMMLTLMVCLVTFTVLYALLMLIRIAMKNDEIEIRRLKLTGI
ncbi:MAG: cytochrome c biogenesis protein CcsA [Chloroflexota bacterium]